MREKAEQILNQIREKDRKRRVLARLKDASTMDSMNRMHQDEPARVGNDQEIKVLKEMNEMQQFENNNWSRGTV